MRRLQGGTNRNFMCFYQITRESDHSRNEENENCETLKQMIQKTGGKTVNCENAAS